MDLTLSPLDSGNHPTVRIPYEDLEYEKGAEDYPAEIGEREGSDVETEEWNDEVEIREQHYKEFVIGAKQAEPEDFEPPFGVSRVNLREEFGTSGVQVIVKLASIFLTPEKPDYPGGSWHIEGKENEHICASAIYYYENDYITASELSFRQKSNNRELDDFDYEQGYHEWLNQIFGIQNYDAPL